MRHILATVCQDVTILFHLLTSHSDFLSPTLNAVALLTFKNMKSTVTYTCIIFHCGFNAKSYWNSTVAIKYTNNNNKKKNYRNNNNIVHYIVHNLHGVKLAFPVYQITCRPMQICYSVTPTRVWHRVLYCLVITEHCWVGTKANRCSHPTRLKSH